jgi:hypothetical protein
MDVSREASWCAAGANFIIHSSDIIATRTTLTAEVNALRQHLSDAGRATSDEGASTV